jgi:hypothetical protein
MVVRYFRNGQDFDFGPRYAKGGPVIGTKKGTKMSIPLPGPDNMSMDADSSGVGEEPSETSLGRSGRIARSRAGMSGLGNAARRIATGPVGPVGAATSLAAAPRPAVKRGGVPAFARGGPLTAAERNSLPKSDFALPGKGEGKNGKGSGSYPIPDANHARNALARVAQHGTAAEKAAVRAKVHAKYPDIGKK